MRVTWNIVTFEFLHPLLHLRRIYRKKIIKKNSASPTKYKIYQ